MYQEAISDPSEDCPKVRGAREWPAVAWVEYYARSLDRQRPWPLCTCEYEWALVERSCATTLTAEAERVGVSASATEAF